MAGAGEALPRPGPGRNGRGGRHPGSHASAPGGLTRRKRRGAADPGLRAPPARSSPSMLFRASRAPRRTAARASARRSVSGPCGWGIRGGSGSCSRPTSQDSAHLSPSRPEAAARSSSRVAVMHAVGSPRPGARSARAANRDGLWWSNPIVASRRSARTDNGEAGSAPCGGGVRAAVVRLFGPGERPPSGARRQQAPGEARESLSGAAAPLFLTSLLSCFLTRPCRLVRERGAEGHRPPAWRARLVAGRGGAGTTRPGSAEPPAGPARCVRWPGPTTPALGFTPGCRCAAAKVASVARRLTNHDRISQVRRRDPRGGTPASGTPRAGRAPEDPAIAASRGEPGRRRDL